MISEEAGALEAMLQRVLARNANFILVWLEGCR